MDFWLYYRGELKSNGTADDKHKIRKTFHNQIKNLWSHLPLINFPPKDEDGVTGSLIKRVKDFRFITFVISEAGLFAELDITMLRPGEPGKIILSGGDIDNRLKTLFDALRYPNKEQEIPPEENPNQDYYPLYCLLEDDALISRVNVISDRFLDASGPDEVLLLIHVSIKSKGIKHFWPQALGL